MCVASERPVESSVCIVNEPGRCVRLTDIDHEGLISTVGLSLSSLSVSLSLSLCVPVLRVSLSVPESPQAVCILSLKGSYGDVPLSFSL